MEKRVMRCEVLSVTLQRGVADGNWVKVQVGSCGLVYVCRPEEAPPVGSVVRVTVDDLPLYDAAGLEQEGAAFVAAASEALS